MIESLFSLVSSFVLWLAGWRFEGALPTDSKLLLVVAPHTSNWDFPVAILFKWKLKIRGNYLGKHTIFRGPLGWFVRSTGGIPVYRHEQRNVVDQVADMYAQRQRLWLGIAPAGTRSHTDHWRSGFYYMALAAKVPLLPAGLDFSQKRLVLGPTVQLTGVPRDDMDLLREFFSPFKGHRPDEETPVRLRVESDPDEVTDIYS